MHNVFGGRTSALYIDSMNLHRFLSTFPGNPSNGVGVLFCISGLMMI